jgi:hypothetical protein
LLNKPFPEEIRADEHEAKIKEYLATQEEKRRKDEERIATEKEHLEVMGMVLSEDEAEANAMDDTDIAMSPGGKKLVLNPLRPILLPLQLILGQVCIAVRIARSFVIWDESYGAFFITNGCVLGGLALIWVPWAYIMRWLLRVVVWVVLGPWMKLVDIFYVQKLAKRSKGEVLADRIKTRGLGVVLAKRARMIRREDAMKLKALKRYMFGKYIARVPRFKEYRFRDVPLQVSTAVPCGGGPGSKYHISSRRHGQHLVGHMIPTW